MKSYSIITRNGILNFKGIGIDSYNQCASQGHEVYSYTLKILFQKNVLLDRDGWIIEHSLLDNEIQQTEINSCELMSKNILNRIEGILKLKKLAFIGVKLIIRPYFVATESSAFFQECRCEKRDLMLLTNL